VVGCSPEHVSRRTSVTIFAGASCCASSGGYPVNAVSELAYQRRPSAGKLTPSSQEMSARLSWNAGHRKKRQASPCVQQTTHEFTCRHFEFLALMLHSSSLLLLLILCVHRLVAFLLCLPTGTTTPYLTSLWVPRRSLICSKVPFINLASCIRLTQDYLCGRRMRRLICFSTYRSQ
jgi:hypothetical protein